MDLGSLVNLYGNSTSPQAQGQPTKYPQTNNNKKSQNRYHGQGPNHSAPAYPPMNNANLTGYYGGYIPQNGMQHAQYYGYQQPGYYQPPAANPIQPQANHPHQHRGAVPPYPSYSIPTMQPNFGSAPAMTPSWEAPALTPNFVPAQPAPLVDYQVKQQRPPKRQHPRPSSATSPSAPAAAEEGSFHCEPCDKAFKQQKFYDAHMATHIPCSYEGCKFSAVKAIMKSHELIHMKNMFNKLETPEEIERYREERRKRFPTQETVAKRKEEDEKRRKELREANPRFPRHDSDRSRNQHQREEEGEISDEEDMDGDRNAKRKRPMCKFYRMGRCKNGRSCSFAHENPQKRQKTGSAGLRKRKQIDNLFESFLDKEKNFEKQALLICFKYIVDHNFFSRKPEVPPANEVSV